MSDYLSIYPSVHPSIHPSIYLPLSVSLYEIVRICSQPAAFDPTGPPHHRCLKFLAWVRFLSLGNTTK